MNGFISSDDHQPVTWYRGYPLYAAHLLMGVFTLSMVATALLNFGGGGALLQSLVFRSDLVLHGQAWRILTYGLVNAPSLWFAVEMYMIVAFGREVERFFGRRIFLTLAAGLYLLAPLLLTVLGLWRPTALVGEATCGFALFIAFATLYPNAVMLFNILAKWVAIIFVGIYVLADLSDHLWDGLLVLAATVGFAYGFVRLEQGHFSMPTLGFRRRAKEPAAQSHGFRVVSDPDRLDVDDVLDKIARAGMGSLTDQERAKLSEAAVERAKRDEARRKQPRKGPQNP
jgi:membrane associated rhomboid family serine protease